MVNSNLVVGLTMVTASIVLTLVVFSMGGGNLNTSTGEALGEKSVWMITYPGSAGVVQRMTVDVSGAAPHMMIETVESEWSKVQVFQAGKQTTWEKMSPTKLLDTCVGEIDENTVFTEEMEECLEVQSGVKDSCNSVDDDISYMANGDAAVKPVARGIRRTMRRKLTKEANKRRLDENFDDLSEEEKAAALACLDTQELGCGFDDFVAEEELAHQSEHDEGELEADSDSHSPGAKTFTLEDGTVIENALAFGKFIVQLDENNVPVSFVGEGGTAFANIVSISEWNEEDKSRMNADNSCDAGRRNERKMMESMDKKILGGRKLQVSDNGDFVGFDGVTYVATDGGNYGFMGEYAAGSSNAGQAIDFGPRDAVQNSPYGWCGPGTDLATTPCPNDGDQIQYACRRHDHSRWAEYGAAAPDSMLDMHGIFLAAMGIGTVRMSCQADYDLLQAAVNCQGPACDQDIASSQSAINAAAAIGVGSVKDMIIYMYAKDGMVGNWMGCADMALYSAFPYTATVQTEGAHQHNAGTHGHESCGWRGCSTVQENNHNIENHASHSENMVVGIQHNIIPRYFKGPSRYTCQLGNNLGLSAYTYGTLKSGNGDYGVAFGEVSTVSTVMGDIMMFASTGIAMTDPGPVDHKPACYSHYTGEGGMPLGVGGYTGHANQDTQAGSNYVMGGFLLHVNTNGQFDNDCTNCDYSTVQGASGDRTYTHYTEPHFHNFRYDKPGMTSEGPLNSQMGGHFNSDGKFTVAATMCKDDQTIFNTGAIWNAITDFNGDKHCCVDGNCCGITADDTAGPFGLFAGTCITGRYSVNEGQMDALCLSGLRARKAARVADAANGNTAIMDGWLWNGVNGPYSTADLEWQLGYCAFYRDPGNYRSGWPNFSYGTHNGVANADLFPYAGCDTWGNSIPSQAQGEGDIFRDNLGGLPFCPNDWDSLSPDFQLSNPCIPQVLYGMSWTPTSQGPKFFWGINPELPGYCTTAGCPAFCVDHELDNCHLDTPTTPTTPDPCTASCGTHGSITGTGSTCSCACDAGYSGDSCETQLDPQYAFISNEGRSGYKYIILREVSAQDAAGATTSGTAAFLNQMHHTSLGPASRVTDGDTTSTNLWAGHCVGKNVANNYLRVEFPFDMDVAQIAITSASHSTYRSWQTGDTVYFGRSATPPTSSAGLTSVGQMANAVDNTFSV